MKKILIINGHPKKDSFNSGLLKEYKRGAEESGAEIREINVSELPLENYLRYDHFSGDKLGDEIIKSQKDVKWADHLVFVHPVWWGAVPAILKEFLEVVFAAGFAFRYTGKGSTTEKLLAGKTARIITTLDTPVFIYKYFFGAPSVNQLKNRTLEFCGISPVKVSYFGPIQSSTEITRKKFLNDVYTLGKNLA